MKCQKPFKYLSCEIIIFETREKKVERPKKQKQKIEKKDEKRQICET